MNRYISTPSGVKDTQTGTNWGLLQGQKMADNFNRVEAARLGGCARPCFGSLNPPVGIFGLPPCLKCWEVEP